MDLTQSQLIVLRDAINADPALASQPLHSDGAFAIAEALNKTASPDFIVWKSTVSVEEIMQNGFVWTAVDSLTNGKARIWEWMTRFGYINPSKANVRQGIADCFGGASAMVAGIMPHCKRKASRVEKIFATGTGTDASPATMIFIGSISYQTVEQARAS